MADTIVRVYENETRVIIVSGDLIYHYASLAILAAEEAEANATISTNERIAIVAAIAGWPSGGGLTVPVASIALLKALTTLSGAVFLYESGRHGTFAWSALNLSAQVTADPNNGIYVAPNSAPTGASGAWVRQEIVGGVVQGSWFGLSANGTTDDAAKINSALALTAVRELRLGASTFALNSQITIPTGKTLAGAGSDITYLKRLTYSLGLPSTTSVVNAANGTHSVTVRDLTVNGNRAGNGGGANDRCHGIVIGSTNFLIERCFVENVTGYAFYNAAGVGQECNGVLRDCECWNFNVGFEQTGTGDTSGGIHLFNCNAHQEARDGGAQISFGTESCYQIYGGASGISYTRCRADGETDGLIHSLDTADVAGFALIACEFVMSGSGSALNFAATGSFNLTNLEIVGGRYYAEAPTANSAAFFKRALGVVIGATFENGDGTNSVIVDGGCDLHFSGCRASTTGPTVGTDAAYALFSQNGGKAKWDGGTLSVLGASGYELMSAGAVRISNDTLNKRITAGTQFYSPILDLNGSLQFGNLPSAYASNAAALADGRTSGYVYRNSTTNILTVVV